MTREIKFDYLTKNKIDGAYSHNYLTIDVIQQGISGAYFVQTDLCCA